MNKNIIITNDLKKDLINKNFLEFIESFYEKKTKENKYKFNKETFVIYAVGLLVVECLVYNSNLFQNDFKALNMIGFVCVGLIASSKIIINMVSMNLQRKQRKTELAVIDEKTNYWLIAMQKKKKDSKWLDFLLKKLIR